MIPVQSGEQQSAAAHAAAAARHHHHSSCVERVKKCLGCFDVNFWSIFSFFAGEIKVRSSRQKITLRVQQRTTKNSDNGSGGERNAPRTKALNQMWRLYLRTSFRVMISSLNTINVATGAWKPTADAMARFAIKPTYPERRHSVDRPAFCASVVRYSKSCLLYTSPSPRDRG